MEHEQFRQLGRKNGTVSLYEHTYEKFNLQNNTLVSICGKLFGGNGEVVLLRV